MAYHGVDAVYLFRAYQHIFEEQGLHTHSTVSDAIGEAWLAFIHVDEPWSGAETGTAAHFGEAGMQVLGRDEVRMNGVQKDRLRMWRQVGLVNAGRIANLWMSEQDDRGIDGEFVY